MVVLLKAAYSRPSRCAFEASSRRFLTGPRRATSRSARIIAMVAGLLATTSLPITTHAADARTHTEFRLDAPERVERQQPLAPPSREIASSRILAAPDVADPAFLAEQRELDRMTRICTGCDR